MDEVKELARLIKILNGIHIDIAKIIDRPAQIGHVGEFLASRIFNIELEESATNPGSDGRFRDEPLSGKTVNIKWYGKRENILDINPNSIPDYYLVLTGPKTAPQSSRGAFRPWVIESVYLFDSQSLIRVLEDRHVKIGIATSVRKHQWEDAELYPNASCKTMILSDTQKELLRLFAT